MSGAIVILVLANRVPPLRGLLSLIDGRFEVIIHLDSKANTSSEKLDLPSHAIATEKRYPVFWGGFNMILAIREMIDTAYRRLPRFQRAVLVTGDSLPVVNLDCLEQNLMDRSLEYIQLIELAKEPSLRGLDINEAQRRGAVLPWRFQNYVSYDDELESPRSREEAMRKFGISENQTDYIRGSVQTITRGLLASIPPRPDLYEKLFYGASWWALTREALDLIIDDAHSKAHVDYFRLLQVPDEHFFHTLLGNKSRALASLQRQMQGPLVFVDHQDPQRRLGTDALSLGGFREAGHKHRTLFARKYDPLRAPEVAAAIERRRYFAELDCGG